jgi:hypothetical protein
MRRQGRRKRCNQSPQSETREPSGSDAIESSPSPFAAFDGSGSWRRQPSLLTVFVVLLLATAVVALNWPVLLALLRRCGRQRPSIMPAARRQQ